jgi:hypothetical protein
MASCHATKLSPAPCGGGTILHPVLQHCGHLSGRVVKLFLAERYSGAARLLLTHLQEMHEYRSGVSTAGWPMMDQNWGLI